MCIYIYIYQFRIVRSQTTATEAVSYVHSSLAYCKYIYVYYKFGQLATLRFTSCAYTANALSFSVVKLPRGSIMVVSFSSLYVFGLF
jgi:hypothetical protein